ncbi:MAG TPA: hypothetical protein ENJ53_03805 [Phaeodactylibacter sp.]|nr:hypothetical protein [Phaeodactylibacter sp.]
MRDHKKIFYLFQAGSFSLLLAVAYQHLFWDAPYRALLWDREMMEGLVNWATKMSWEDYVTNLEMDACISNVIKMMGGFYLIAAVASLWVKRFYQFVKPLLIIASISLFFLALLYAKESFSNPFQFFEHSLQWTSPLFLIWLVKSKTISARFVFFVKLAIALTFLAHGLYALNVFPRPGLFMEMTMNITGMEEKGTVHLLNTVGCLDLISSVGIFLPTKWARWFLYYIIFWGFWTTMARVWAFTDTQNLLSGLHEWGYETLIRFPHFLIPIALLLFLSDDR